MVLNYWEIYEDIRKWLLKYNPTSTPQITSSIKDYFLKTFEDSYEVLPNKNNSEYLLDVMVTSFKPVNIIEPNGNSLNIIPNPIENYIAVESELGGSSGSSISFVHKNVVYDYVKLLLVNAKYKIMIFTSLPYAKENNHVANRVKNLRDIYLKVCPNDQGVLLIHLPGKKSRNKSKQVQAHIHGLSGYIISGDGKHFGQIEI